LTCTYTKLFVDLQITKADVAEGLTKYNSELINLECDYPHVDKQYSQILFTLSSEVDMIDFQKILWYSPNDEMSDIFFKVFIRLAERSFTVSEHDHEELTEFVKKHELVSILEGIKQYLLEENLLSDYQSEIQSHDLIYSELGLSV
jgi:hypothetical protein